MFRQNLLKHLLFFCLISIVLSACSSPTPDEIASLAARGYYEHLMRGEYDEFLEGKAGADSLPDAYREQLLVCYKQFMSQQMSMHQGINEIRIINARRDSLLTHTNVFLMLCFDDSTNEQVSVPMIEHNGNWKMK